MPITTAKEMILFGLSTILVYCEVFTGARLFLFADGFCAIMSARDNRAGGGEVGHKRICGKLFGNDFDVESSWTSDTVY